MEGGGREGGEEGVGGEGKGRERLGGGGWGGMNTGRCMCGINYDTHARKVSIAVCAVKDDVIITSQSINDRLTSCGELNDQQQ